MRFEDLPREKIFRIRALLLDVDGVMTDGGITYTSSGEELKTFNAKDGAGVKYWHRAGHASAIITGRSSPIVERRAAELGITVVEMGAKVKLPAFEMVLQKLSIAPEECVYVGDDLPDLPLIRAAGIGVAVADAVVEAKETADWVTELPGGRGAVREVIEKLLRAQGRWDALMARYLAEAGKNEYA
jgi:3-deoxy-D-manno-octulosonate 8-phosphate phosphatase (KDO 8-P phosphatase)